MSVGYNSETEQAAKRKMPGEICYGTVCGHSLILCSAGQSIAYIHVSVC